MSDLGPSSAIQLAVVLTLITLAPAVILTCTTFARFAIVFSFMKMGLGTQGAPPNQVLAGLALFMTMFVMAPVTENLHTHALAPYLAKEMDEAQALEAATPYLRSFLLANATEGDLGLFYEVSDQPRPETEADVPLKIAIPAFVLSELRTAFQMGFLVLLPFLIIDLIVATVLSSLGMVMLPPAVVAMPVKLLVFLAADGWYLMVGSLFERSALMLLDLWTEALMVLITVGGPFVVVALAVGLLTSIFQTATQLQENIIAFVPKVVAVGALLALAGSWLLSQLVRHFESIALAIEQLGSR